MTRDSTVSPTPSGRPEIDFLQDQAQLIRANVYQMLANLLAREPARELIQALAEIGEVDASDGQIAMGWEMLSRASGKTTVEEVKDEYFDLFLGVGRGELVPFGSWYMTGFLMEKPVSALRADLETLGIQRQDGVAESEDHIAGLCDAMALMIKSTVASAEDADFEVKGDKDSVGYAASEIGFNMQQKFFKDHIDPWAARFFADLQTAKAARFYRAVGFFGESFIDFEQQFFDMKI